MVSLSYLALCVRFAENDAAGLIYSAGSKSYTSLNPMMRLKYGILSIVIRKWISKSDQTEF